MTRQGIVHFFGDASVASHPLEGMPEGVKHFRGIRYAARRAQVTTKPLRPRRRSGPLALGFYLRPQRGLHTRTALEQRLAVLQQANPLELAMQRHLADGRTGLGGAPSSAINIEVPSLRVLVLPQIAYS